MKDPHESTYFENLDGLRFLSFLSVFFYHSFDTRYSAIRESAVYQFVRGGLFQHANLGVNLFFVLSGFLITYLLIEEKTRNSYIDLPRFWTRRILRIWPLFYISLFFGFSVFPVIKTFFGQIPNESANIWYYLTFLNNFDVIEKGTPDASILGALWSVAVEEQFYLLWPVVLQLLPIRKYWIAFSTVIVISWIYRMGNDSPQLHHFHTLSCMGDMAIGSMGAWLVSQRESFRKTVTEWKPNQIALIYFYFIGIFFFREELFRGVYVIRIFERTLIAVVMISIILEQCYSKHSLFKISRLHTISKLGIISYGLYCFHFVGILIAKTITHKFGYNTSLWQVLILETAIALAATITISRICYYYIETPFLKIKKRFAFTTRRMT